MSKASRVGSVSSYVEKGNAGAVCVAGEFICHTAFATEGGTLHGMSAVHPWRTVPRRVKIIFLLAVFFVFAIISFANDTMDMGRCRADAWSERRPDDTAFGACGFHLNSIWERESQSRLRFRASSSYLPKIFPKKPPLFFSPLFAPLELAARLGADFTESWNLIGSLSHTPIASG